MAEEQILDPVSTLIRQGVWANHAKTLVQVINQAVGEQLTFDFDTDGNLLIVNPYTLEYRKLATVPVGNYTLPTDPTNPDTFLAFETDFISI